MRLSGTDPRPSPSAQAAGNTYYRYYTTSWSNADGSRGTTGQLKMVVGAEGYRSYDWGDNGALDDGVLSASDANLTAFSQAYFEYPSSGTDWRPSSAFFSGECGCSGGVDGVHTFEYEDSGSLATYLGNGSYDTAWARRTIVGRPDGTYLTQHFDETGQPLMKVITDGDPAVSYTDDWEWTVARDGAGLVTQTGTPANVTGFTYSGGTYVQSSGVGLWTR